MDCKIRRGTKADLPSVLELIKELASYERAPGEVTNTLEDMELDGFGEIPVFSFLVAEQKEKIVGMALYYTKYSTWKGKGIYLDDIVVSEKYRGNGIGKKLFEEIIKISREAKAKILWWQVLDWNTPAIDFYKKFDSRFDGEWVNCKLTEEQIINFSFEGK